jgi:hypothetical protein
MRVDDPRFWFCGLTEARIAVAPEQAEVLRGLTFLVPCKDG